LGKCQFLKKRIEFLGYTVSSEGITLSTRHTQAISDFPQLKNEHEVQRFLGLASYFRKFIHNFVVKPLYSLLKKTVKFNFDTECIKVFETLKRELLAYPVLRLYNQSSETQLHTDASSIDLGAILLQKQLTGE